MNKLVQEMSWNKANLAAHRSDYRKIINRIQRLPSPYIGNKKKLLPSIASFIEKHNLEFDSFLDAFSGSAIVSLLMKAMGKRVIANDVLISSYYQAVALVQNNEVKLTDDVIDYILHHKNKKESKYIQSRWTGIRFTEKEAKTLDMMLDNLRYFYGEYIPAIAFSAIKLVCMKLPFGFIDRSVDIYNHRKKQIKAYGKGSQNHDRRIGIYYDDHLNLNFDMWFPKYVKKLQMGIISSKVGCEAENYDIIDSLKKNNVDCVYFDPPYGGSASDYGYLYEFFEECLHLTHLRTKDYKIGLQRFSDKTNYEENFIEMLEHASHIPIWIFSYNDSSWNGLEHIISLIKNFRTRVEIETIPYPYKYRNKTNKIGNEHLILARN